MDQKSLTTPEFYWYNKPTLEGRALELVEELLAHKTNYVGLTKKHVEAAIAKGEIVICLIEEDGLDVWFVTKVITNETGIRELLILAVKGTGVFKFGDRLLKAWIEIAAHHGCQFIYTQTSEPAVGRILKKFKFMPLSESFVYSVPLGKRN